MNICASLLAAFSRNIAPSGKMAKARRGLFAAAVSLFALILSTAGLAAQDAGSTSSRAVAANAATTLPDAPVAGPNGDSSSSDDSSAEFLSANLDTLQVPPKDAADAKAPPNAAQSERAPQTKRILGLIPNFRAITTDERLPPQSVKEKFVTASEDSFDYSSIVIPAVLAGYSLSTNSTPEFGHGGVGYARYLWHATVDQTSENYMVEFFAPVATHEDTRYYTLARGGFIKRAAYSLSRTVITRSDSGKEVFNLSEVVGAGASAGLSSLYYPSRERSLGNTGTEWGLDVGVDALADLAKEFWPDINHWMFHGVKPGTPAP
jgi:hypothetical protein